MAATAAMVPVKSAATSAGAVVEETIVVKPAKKPARWHEHDAKAQKQGQRGTIYWVGKNIIGEDGQLTGMRSMGASYHGEWKDNRKSGYGVQVYPTGEKYEGQWLNGQRHGEGTLWVPVGKSMKLRKLYVGGWRNDKQHGMGTCFFKNGELFQGMWDNGTMHGHGTLRYTNGDMYIGDFHDGMRSGQGTLNKANGDCYEGSWLDDQREGIGSYFYSESGKVFVGEWAKDLPKAGIYTQAHQNPEQAMPVPVTRQLPPVRLAKPAEVLDTALNAVRQERVGRLFTEEEIEAMRMSQEAAEAAEEIGATEYIPHDDDMEMDYRGSKPPPQRGDDEEQQDAEAGEA